MNGSAFERVTAALERKTGPGRAGQWRCPAHDDQNPSLTVTAAEGKVVLCCHRDCSVNDIVAALDLSMRDLFDQPAQNGNGNGKTIVATYDYLDATGRLLFQKVRYSPKSFAQRRPDPEQPGKWLWKLGDIAQPLYRLPEVLAGLAADRTVFVVEGEKDVDALTKAGKVATTNPGGAGKWRAEHTEVLAGATEVIVWADKDVVGWRHARDIHRALQGRVGAVRVVEGRGGGKDAADHLAAGHGPDDYGDITTVIDERCEDEQAPGPPSGSSNSAVEAPIGLSLRPLVRVPVDLTVPIQPPVMLNRFLYAGCLTVIQSEPGVGKSWLEAWLAMLAMAEGHTVMCLDEEGGLELITSRLQALGADPAMVADLFFYYPFPQRTWGDEDVIALRAAIAEARQVAPLAFGVLDSLPDFLTAAQMDENSAVDVTRFVATACAPFREAGAACVVLDHLTKPSIGDGRRHRSRYSRGSGAKLAKADATLLIEAPKPFDVHTSGQLAIWKTKDRRGVLDLPQIGSNPYVVDVQVAEGTISFEEKGVQAVDDNIKGLPKSAQRVLAVLRTAHEWLTATQVQERTKGDGSGLQALKLRTVQDALKRLHDDDHIVTYGLNNKGQAGSYAHPDATDRWGQPFVKDQEEF